MEIKKAFVKDGQLVISYHENDNSYTIKSSDTPRPELAKALEGMKEILYRNLEVFLPTDYELRKTYPDDTAYKDIKRSVARAERLRVVDHFRVIGFSHSQSEQNGDLYKVMGLYITSSNRIPISTSAMSVPEHGEEFWKAGNEPSAHLTYLTPEDVAAIERFEEAVQGFIKGERDQKELFTEEGDPTEDADNCNEESIEEDEVDYGSFSNDPCEEETF